MLFGKGEEYGLQSNDEPPVNRNAHCKSGIGWLLDSKGWRTWYRDEMPSKVPTRRRAWTAASAVTWLDQWVRL